MSHFEHALPQLTGKTCITDGGLETDLHFNRNIQLPEFAAYDLLRTDAGYQTLLDYFKTYAELAQRYRVGLILETPTWRANPDWADKIGDSAHALEQLNLASVRLLEDIRAEYATEETPVVISGCVGPRGDGYTPGALMSAVEARAYHDTQIAIFAASSVDMISAMTLNYVDEAIGITHATQQYALPVCISFTVETDGKLPTGETLQEAIEAVDEATDQGPVYYMINCAHTTHFDHLFEGETPWLSRVKGLRGNASCLSHAELDESEVLDDGDPVAFGEELQALRAVSNHITVLGGCCGTDHRHIEQVCRQVGAAA